MKAIPLKRLLVALTITAPASFVLGAALQDDAPALLFVSVFGFAGIIGIAFFTPWGRRKEHL